jgi:hypothetical protein
MSTIKRIMWYSAFAALAFARLIVLIVAGFLTFATITEYKPA